MISGQYASLKALKGKGRNRNNQVSKNSAMLRSKGSLFVGCALAAATCSCSSLSHINSFATTSEKALQKFQEIDFSATRYCREIVCQDPTSYSTGNIIETANCNCSDFVGADKGIRMINAVLTTYLGGLEKLSTKNSTKFSFAGLATSTEILSDNLRLGLKSEEVKAMRDLSTAVAASALAGWRRAELKKTIENARNSLVVVLDAQRRNIGFLRNIISEERKEIQIAYETMATNTSETSLRYLLNHDRLKTDLELRKQDLLLDHFGTALEKIKNEYLTVYDYRSSLKDPIFVQSLISFSAGIDELFRDYNSLNK
jgi:hypothetical protein